MFIKNIWYVCAWSDEVPMGEVEARVVAGEPIALWRNSNDGSLNAFQNRCPHRHAPLSMGRIEDNELRCMYHGLKFSREGKCVHIPGTDHRPDNIDVRTFPVVERDGWIWVWIGDKQRADPALVPRAWGLDNENMTMKTGAIDYDADYQLINDNLTDLSHLDFVHETTLSRITGSKLSDDLPSVSKLKNGVRIQRWLPAKPVNPASSDLFETWVSTDYLLPGVFLTIGALYPEGTAKSVNFGEPDGQSVLTRLEQQAVTPRIAGKCRYMFATGAPKITDGEAFGDTSLLFDIAQAAFAEDKEIIEAQQAIWDLTPEDAPKAFIPQDKAPAMFRRMISALLREEQNAAVSS